jgi:hypothetical protein
MAASGPRNRLADFHFRRLFIWKLNGLMILQDRPEVARDNAAV